MQEKYGDPYIPLMCGHFITHDEDRLFRNLAPLLPGERTRNKHYCDKCETWQRRKPRQKPRPLPEIPLF